MCTLYSGLPDCCCGRGQGEKGGRHLGVRGSEDGGGNPLVLDGVLEAMVLESVDLLVLGSGRNLLGRERKRVFRYQCLENSAVLKWMAMMCACASVSLSPHPLTPPTHTQPTWQYLWPLPTDRPEVTGSLCHVRVLPHSSCTCG